MAVCSIDAPILLGSVVMETANGEISWHRAIDSKRGNLDYSTFSESKRLLEEGAIGRLVKAGQFDEALVELYADAERDPGNPQIKRAISELRNRMAEAALGRIGPSDSVPARGQQPPFVELEADEEYLLSLVDGTTTLESIVRTSTLGLPRTARVLTTLVERGLVIAAADGRSKGAVSRSNRVMAEVVVAVAEVTQASLIRTMLRAVVGHGTPIVSTATFGELQGKIRNTPALLIVDFRLPGAPDALTGVTQMRRDRVGLFPAIVLAQRIERDFVKPRLPTQSRLLTRPIERAELYQALKELVPKLVVK